MIFAKKFHYKIQLALFIILDEKSLWIIFSVFI